MPTRRQYLASLAAGGLATIGTASADGYPSRPDHITSVTGDVDVIAEYQPSLITSIDARQSMVGTYGWRAESSEHDVDAYYWWIVYPTQDGFLGSFGDSHFLDHEPIIFYVNSDGTVESIVFSGYHHFVAEEQDPRLVEDRVAGTPTHPKLQVVDPHHHYRHYDSDDRDGVRPDTISGTEFRSWLAVREAWYDNDVYSKSHHPAIEDPFLLRERDTWWEDGSVDAWVGKNVWPLIGHAGYDERGDLRGDV